jgi:hypothetical protein
MCLEREKVRRGEFSAAIYAMRKALEALYFEGQVLKAVWGTSVLVDALLKRRAEGDAAEAAAAIDRLANLPDGIAGAVRDIWLLRLRALLARAHGDETNYREYRDRYRELATSLGFEGHMKWAEAMS